MSAKRVRAVVAVVAAGVAVAVANAGSALAAPAGPAAPAAPVAAGTDPAAPVDRGTIIQVPPYAPPVVELTGVFGPGDVFSVAAFENASTGYVWSFALPEQDPPVVAYLDTDFVYDTYPPLPGTGGTRYFRLQALHTGQAVVSLAYQRPWEGVPLQQVTLTVTVW